MISVPSDSKMDNEKLERLILKLGENMEGQPGFWQFEFAQRRLICLTDESHDRMRLMTPVATSEHLSPELVLECLKANFDRALDARYCLNGDTLWTAFIHPLGSLSSTQFASACSQVVEAADNFGSKFSSGGLSFNTDII